MFTKEPKKFRTLFVQNSKTVAGTRTRVSMLRLNTFVALVLLVVAASATASRPKYQNATNDNRDITGTTCYTNTGATGSYMDYFDWAPSLGTYDNSFRSCCMNGIWMWYNLEDYNYADFNVCKYQTSIL